MGRRGDGKDDEWRRRREREDEADRDFDLKRERSGTSSGIFRGLETPLSSDPNQKLNELLQQVGPLTEQVNNLYQMFFSGAEKRPPLERRQLLESMIQQIQGLPKATSAVAFRAQTVVASFTAHRDRWDKLLREREKGKR